MGQDFLEGKKDRAKRGWNRASFSRQSPALFDRLPQLKGRTFTAKLRSGQTAKTGETLLLLVEPERQSVARGNSQIADCINLPQEVASDVSLHGGALATEVVKVNPISNTVELAYESADKAQ